MTIKSPAYINESGSIVNSARLVNRITVGTNGTYTTLKAACDWFNASATSATEIILDAGNHAIADTVTVNNASYNLSIKGVGSNCTILQAATGLLNKPMFNIKTNCDLNRLGATGSTLASYGDSAGENFINYDTADIYSEVTDCIVDTFYYGLYDTGGMNLFFYNFICDTMTKGVAINHTNANPASTDIEVGNFIDCAVGVDLIKATNDSFICRTLVFDNPALGIGIQYDGANYGFSGFSEIMGCTHNGVGDFISGFDFHRQDGRDKNIVISGNVGLEDKNPHAKLNVIDNTALTTTVTTAGTFYKVVGIRSNTRIIFDAAATAGTFTITYDGETTAAIAYNASAADIKSALEALTGITTVTVTQVVASKEWAIRFDTAAEGWDDTQTVDISGLTTTTAVDVIKSFYNCKTTLDIGKITYQPDNPRDCRCWVGGNVQVNQVNRNVTLGIKKNNTGQIISPMTVRCSASGQPYAIPPIIAYLDDVESGDYFELFVTSSTNGDVVTLQDLNWYFESR